MGKVELYNGCLLVDSMIKKGAHRGPTVLNPFDQLWISQYSKGEVNNEIGVFFNPFFVGVSSS